MIRSRRAGKRRSRGAEDAVGVPAGFVARMQAMLGPEAADFLAALAAPEEGLRVNTLRLSPDQLDGLLPLGGRRMTYPPEGVILPPGSAAGRHPYHAAGLYYLQDPGAIMVGAAVDARPGEWVLDLSAAPGGKATHLAARMNGGGLLVANDVSRPRGRELVRNLERLGVRNAVATVETPERLARHFGPAFDRVLVDAPCSGESMFHKSTAARRDWSPASVAGCARRQAEIVDAAAALVAPRGLLVYSTCTFSEEENERVVERFLADHPEFEPGELPEVPGGVPVGETPGGGAAGYRLWPHRAPGAGHFLFGLRRRGAIDARSSAAASARPREVVDARPPPAAPRPGREGAELFASFTAEVYPGAAVDPDRLERVGDELFQRPADAPELAGLHVLRSGVWLGSVRKGRFEPSHALALALPPGGAAVRLDLSAADPRVGRYLSGQTLPAAGADGWTVVTVDGYALGWGKATGGMLKNHYPKGLRATGAAG